MTEIKIFVIQDYKITHGSIFLFLLILRKK